ncbi:MAG: hypothetical protein RIE08_15230 [Acidimicrobiales bacterium]
MSDAEKEDLLRSVPISRRKMLKRMLAGGAVAYTAPVVASFAVNPAGAEANSDFFGGNQTWGGNQTFGGNQKREPFFWLRALFNWLFRLFGR